MGQVAAHTRCGPLQSEYSTDDYGSLQGGCLYSETMFMRVCYPAKELHLTA